MSIDERAFPRSNRSVRRGRSLAGAVLALACALSACESSSSAPSPAPSGPRFMVGTVDDSDAWVGVVATDHHARVFVCGGPSSVATMTHWFPVDVDDSGAAQFDAGAGVPSDDLALRVQIGPSSTEGTVTIQGVMHTLHAAPVDGGTIAGLYEANGQCGKLGLIVNQSAAGGAASAQGACVPSAVTTAAGFSMIVQVNPLLPLSRAADGSIRATVTESNEELPLFAASVP